MSLHVCATRFNFILCHVLSVKWQDHGEMKNKLYLNGSIKYNILSHAGPATPKYRLGRTKNLKAQKGDLRHRRLGTTKLEDLLIKDINTMV